MSDNTPSADYAAGYAAGRKAARLELAQVLGPAGGLLAAVTGWDGAMERDRVKLVRLMQDAFGEIAAENGGALSITLTDEGAT